MEAIKNKIPEFLTGGGEMGERIRKFDWSNTPLGPPESWEQSLKTCVRIMLRSSQPIWIGWGKQLIKLYNDAYIDIVRGKHPFALGQPASEVWKEIWPSIEPMLAKNMEQDEGTYVESQLLIMERSGFPEETYYTFSYTPVLGDDGKTAGMICYNTADTDRIINGRSLDTLNKLSKNTLSCKTEKEVFEKAAIALSENQHDFPFFLLYKINEDATVAELYAASAIQKGHLAAPEKIYLKDKRSQLWDIGKSLESKKTLVLTDIEERFGDLPRGNWNVPPSQAMIIPVLLKGKSKPSAVLIAALNPFRKLDDKYINFLRLITEQFAQAVFNVNVIEEERKRLESLVELDKSKTIFFSNISHEFRTPLTLMLGTIEEVLSDPSTNPWNIERITITHRNAMRLLKLVNTLLDFSRIESGRQEALYTFTDLAAYTQNLASNFRSIIEKAGLQLIVKADSPMQPVYVDRQMMEKIVFNLLSNAFKYTLEGKISVTVTSTEKAAVLIVEDTGIGIPKKELPHMFERFHRVEHATGRTFEGTGIGLSLVRELVNLHGGTISLESEEGKGSRFTVTIPFGKDHLPVSKISLKPADISDEISNIYIDEALSILDMSPNSSPKDPAFTKSQHEIKDTVLIVDDNIDMLQHIQSLIGSKFKTITASNGEEALQKIHASPPSLILSDIMMPVMDGIELLKEVKNNPSTQNIPVVLITARAGEESRIEGYSIGADDYLVKPFSSRELIARINSQINLAKKRSAVQKQLHGLFEQAPSAILILKGHDLLIELANDRALQIMNRTKEDTIGKKFIDVLPELEAQGYLQLLRSVYESGERFIAEEAPVTFLHDDVREDIFVKYVFQPLRDEDDQVTGIMIVGDEVTAQVLARNKIAESEQELQRIFKQAPVAINIYEGENFIIRLANDQQLAKWGKSEEEVLNRPLFEAMPEMKDHGLEEMLLNVLKSGESTSFYERKIQATLHGKAVEIYVDAHFEPWLNEAGLPKGIIAIVMDVTERVLARIKLEEANRQLKLAKNQLEIIFKNIPAGIYHFDKNGMIKYLNKQGAALMGYNTSDELMENPDFNKLREQLQNEYVLYDEDGRLLPVEKGSVIRAITTGKPSESVAKFVNKKDNSSFWVLSRSAPIYDEKGELTSILTTSTDITQTKTAEASIRESETRFRTLAEALPQMVWMRNADGTIEYASKDWETYSGIKNISEAWKYMLHPDDWNTIMNGWATASGEGTAFRYEARLKNKAGEYRWHYVAGEPVKDQFGQIIRWIGALTDIHAQKTFTEKLEQEVAQRTDELVKANKELESFNYIASHDLQEPLRKILIFIDRIRHSDDKEAIDTYFEKISSAAGRMRQLIESVLSYSKLSHVQGTLEKVNLNKVLANVISDSELTVKDKKAEIKIEKLPSIKANSQQMHQLFSNLLSNALKFSRSNPVIQISGRSVTAADLKKEKHFLLNDSKSGKSKYAEIRFADNGIGFDDRYKDQIFKLFQRLHGKDEYSGTGIGLSIVKKIIDQHKGFITVNSEEGNGSEFIFWLPVEP